MIGHDNICFMCGRNGSADKLDRHHVFGAANRKHSEKYGLVVMLCHDRCHENGERAAHRDKGTADYLHQVGQKYFEKDHTRDEFMKIFGRNYL